MRLSGQRFQFGLRTLLIVVAIVSLWLGWQVHWIRQRHALLAISDIYPGRVDHAYNYSYFGLDPPANPPVHPAPGMLGLFGEEGVEVIHVHVRLRDEFEQARRLFPEADVRQWGYKGSDD